MYLPVPLAVILNGPVTPLTITLEETPERLSFAITQASRDTYAMVHVEWDATNSPVLIEDADAGARPAASWRPSLNLDFDAEAGCGAPIAGRPDLRVDTDFLHPFLEIEVPRVQRTPTQVKLTVTRLENGGVQMALTASEAKSVVAWCAATPPVVDAAMSLLFALLYTTLGVKD